MSTDRKGKQMNTTVFSFSNYINELGGLAPYTFLCECKACNSKRMVKVQKNEASQFVTKLGYSDELTKEEFDQMHHNIMQQFGENK